MLLFESLDMGYLLFLTAWLRTLFRSSIRDPPGRRETSPSSRPAPDHIERINSVHRSEADVNHRRSGREVTDCRCDNADSVRAADNETDFGSESVTPQTRVDGADRDPVPPVRSNVSEYPSLLSDRADNEIRCPVPVGDVTAHESPLARR